jgi:hypothetical protein
MHDCAYGHHRLPTRTPSPRRGGVGGGVNIRHPRGGVA